MTNFHDFLNEQLQNPEIKTEYDALEPEFSLMQATIDAQKEEEDHMTCGDFSEQHKQIRDEPEN